MRASEVLKTPLTQLGLTNREIQAGRSMSDDMRVETALCAWEAWIDRNYSQRFSWDYGFPHARTCCVAVAPVIFFGWELAVHAHGECSFDWEFVPWFMETCIKWDTEAAYQDGDPEIMPDWVSMCRNHLKPDPAKALLVRCLRSFRATDQGLSHPARQELMTDIERYLKDG